MLRKNTRILLIVFAVLLLAAVFIGRTQWGSGEGGAVEEFPTPTQARYLLGEGQQEIVAITVADAEGRIVRMALKEGEGEEEDVWLLVEPETAEDETDSAMIQSVASQIKFLSILSALDVIPDAGDIGLMSPSHTITLGLKDGSEVVILVGDANPFGTGYYVRIEGQTTELVNKYTLDFILDLLDTPPILPTPMPTEIPTEAPTEAPGEGTPSPTEALTEEPTEAPTGAPTEVPTEQP